MGSANYTLGLNLQEFTLEDQMDNKKTVASKKHNSSVASMVNTIEWLIIAFILAFVFRAFVCEAFVIPTGSMAPTLMGAHFDLNCPNCGYQFEYGYQEQQMSHPKWPRTKSRIMTGYGNVPSQKCPVCNTQAPMPTALSNGDRILVYKSIYQFTKPKRWDVFVFKNPTEPNINYIKRLVGLPGETIHITDGDIYINNKIARKPEKVQEELWMAIYDNDYQTIKERIKQRFQNTLNSKWQNPESNPTIFTLNDTSGKLNEMLFNDFSGHAFDSDYSYNMPVLPSETCSDLMVKLYLSTDSKDSIFGITLGKYGKEYAGYVDLNKKRLSLFCSDNLEKPILEKDITELTSSKPIEMSFANVDHEIKLSYGPYTLSHDFGKSPLDMGDYNVNIKPTVKIAGSGSLKISHLSLYRDMHYTSYRPNIIMQADEKKPFTLNQGEYFACGDNSPASFDSRLWNTEGLGNQDKKFRQGIVPHEYLIGKAFFVYWPHGLGIKPESKIRLVPNVGNLRFIYGGTGEFQENSNIPNS